MILDHPIFSQKIQLTRATATQLTLRHRSVQEDESSKKMIARRRASKEKGER
jgi:hypothetical protein